MFSLLGGLVAATATSALGAFTEGIVISLICHSVARGNSKATLSIKK